MPESGDEASYEHYLVHSGVATFVATGDNGCNGYNDGGQGPDYRIRRLRRSDDWRRPRRLRGGGSGGGVLLVGIALAASRRRRRAWRNPPLPTIVIPVT